MGPGWPSIKNRGYFEATAIDILRRLIDASTFDEDCEPTDDNGDCLFCGGFLGGDRPHRKDCPWDDARSFLSSLEP